MIKKPSGRAPSTRRRLREAREVLQQLGFSGRQQNEMAALTILALLDLGPEQLWSEAKAPLRGITPMMAFMRSRYRREYKPNTRETVRDEVVKHLVEAGLLRRNPDEPSRPTNSGKTVYQLEPIALDLLRSRGTADWEKKLRVYLGERTAIRRELRRERTVERIPVTLPSGKRVKLSPGGQNRLIRQIVEEFSPRFVPGGLVLYLGDAEVKFKYLDAPYLRKLGIAIPAPAKMPDVVVYDPVRSWLYLIEAVQSGGIIDGKRRAELKRLFAGKTAGLVFVSAFTDRAAMRRHIASVSWETEVWIGEDPDHLIHFDGDRSLGPYADTLPASAP